MPARVLYPLALADFLERVRRHSFLVTLGFTLLAAYLFLPPNHARYSTLHFAGHRGIYNSAWVGGAIAMLTSVFLSLVGFYLVRNAVERDRRTGVGQILAATPLSKPLYLLGKFASNFAVLVAMVAVVAAAAGVMQLVRGEVMEIEPLALLTPFVVLTIPVMALVAALAVVFEATPVLRGGLGNVAYFMLWNVIGVMLAAAAPGRGVPDPFGGQVLLSQMHAACVAAFPDSPSGRGLSMGFNFKLEGVWDLRTFVWNGVTWTPAMLASRVSWIVLAVALPMLAALWFDRFGARATEGPGRGRGRRAPAPAIDASPVAAAARVAPRAIAPASSGGLERVPLSGGRARLGGLVLAETRVMLKGVSRWWLLVVLGLVVTGLFVPLAAVKGIVAPATLVWPLLLWSPMGAREQVHRTDALLFSVPRPVARLLVAQWLAGVLVALAVTSGALVRFALTGQWSSFVALMVAVGFVPSMALALGTWSGSGRLFEVLYFMLWYVGPMSRVPALDYVGVTQPEAGAAPVVTFLALSGALAGLALLGRLRQLRR